VSTSTTWIAKFSVFESFFKGGTLLTFGFKLGRNNPQSQ